MHLIMKICLSGPGYTVDRGQDVPFDEAFPFSADEVRRFISPDVDIAAFVGEAAELETWLEQHGVKAPEPETEAATPAAVEPKPAEAAAPANRRARNRS